MSDEKLEKEEKPVESFAELFESYNGHRTERVQIGERIRGKIISVGKDTIYVDTGTKIDGVVEKNELADENGAVPYKEGDESSFMWRPMMEMRFGSQKPCPALAL